MQELKLFSRMFMYRGCGGWVGGWVGGWMEWGGATGGQEWQDCNVTVTAHHSATWQPEQSSQFVRI